MLVEHELLLFAGVFFLIGAIDEFAVDIVWLWLKLTGRLNEARIDDEASAVAALPAAVFIPAWQEDAVIGSTLAHALSVWAHSDLRLYVGCYRNDLATIEAAIAGAGHDPRFRLVIHDRDGPSSKADCLNRLYRALEHDEARSAASAGMIVLHDAEDMVDRHAIGVLSAALAHADMAQLPVVPAVLPESRWISGHYIDEFADGHGRVMVVRDALGSGMPTAGVGCAVKREMLRQLARRRGGDGPFAAESLTEDYELGLNVAALGGRARFVRARDAADGRLIATRAAFPSTLDSAVRQKTRWIHGIAFQSWDRLGWSRRPTDIWMRLRDRRGPLTALVLALAYLLLVLVALDAGLHLIGVPVPGLVSQAVYVLLAVNMVSFVWRAIWRFGVVARDYGRGEGVRAILRIPLANIIAIMAGRRALTAYLRALAGGSVRWDKTRHRTHPALASARSST